MAIKITLCIEDDGSMYLEQGTKEEEAETEGAENRIPVKSIEEALQGIKELAQAGTMPTGEGEMGGEPPMMGMGDEEMAMESAYKGQ